MMIELIYVGLYLLYIYYYTTTINPNIEEVVVDKKVVSPAILKYDTFAYVFMCIASPVLAPFIFIYSTFQYIWLVEKEYIPTKLVSYGLGDLHERIKHAW
jgi:hypothetical protein